MMCTRGDNIKIQITRRQHYVWQYYLSKWTTNNKVWVKRENKIFQSSTKNIMVETDLYEIFKLNELEKHIRDEIIAKDSRPEVDEIVKRDMVLLDAIDFFDFDVIKPSELPKLFAEHLGMKITVKGKAVDAKKMFSNSTEEQRKFIDEKIKKDYEKFRIQYGESLVTSDESEGKKFLDMLLNDDISFFNDENPELLDFYYFVMFKYLRTVKIRKIFLEQLDKIIKLVKENKFPNLDGNAKKIYSHCFYALVTKLSVGLYYDKGYKIMLMKTLNKKFISSDQPVINMIETLNEDGYVSEMKFYMPISPNRAVLIYKSLNDNQVVDVDDKTVEYLNNILKEKSHKTIVGFDKESLL